MTHIIYLRHGLKKPVFDFRGVKMKLILMLMALLVLISSASAGGYVTQQLQANSYGLYYKVNEDYQHVGVSVEDDGSNEFAVEHFVEYTINTMWYYANYVDPSFNGVFRIAGFENHGGYVDEVFFFEVPARDARMMSQVAFLEDGMQYYYDEPSGEEYYVTYPGNGYYTSRTTYEGNGVILVDTYADLYEPQPTGQILVTTQQDTADWNAPL